MGQMNAFLQDAFSRIVAADPRSRFDADYFLSRRFPHDIEEAEWLWVSVAGLKKHLEEIEEDRGAILVGMSERLATDYEPSDQESWARLQSFLVEIRDQMTPRLREILSLRGIRFDEMEVLDRYASELPSMCTLIGEIGELVRAHREELETLPATGATAREIVSATQMLLQGATNRKLSGLMAELDERIRDLQAFVPFWLEEIGRRRALLLRTFDEVEKELSTPTKSSETGAGTG
jgi:hypothetical protein